MLCSTVNNIPISNSIAILAKSPLIPTESISISSTTFEMPKKSGNSIFWYFLVQTFFLYKKYVSKELQIPGAMGVSNNGSAINFLKPFFCNSSVNLNKFSTLDSGSLGKYPSFTLVGSITIGIFLGMFRNSL